MAIVELDFVLRRGLAYHGGENPTGLFGEHPEDDSEKKERDQCNKRDEHQPIVAEFEAHAIS